MDALLVSILMIIMVHVHSVILILIVQLVVLQQILLLYVCLVSISFSCKLMVHAFVVVTMDYFRTHGIEHVIYVHYCVVTALHPHLMLAVIVDLAKCF